MTTCLPRGRHAAASVLAGICLAGCALIAGGCRAAPARAAPVYRGVAIHPLWFQSTQREMDRELTLARAAGSNVVRVDVSWASLETGAKGQLSDWYVHKLDRLVAGARRRRLKVIATLWATPCWASSAPESLKQGCTGAWWDRGVDAYPPLRASDYADAARWLTAHYGERLAALEIWNEPDLNEHRFWRAPDEAAAYAALVKAAYPAAKAGDRSVPVLVGSLASADVPFLQALYADGIGGRYDAISVHPYNGPRAPDDPFQPQYRQYTFLPGLQWVRQAQLAAGDSKPLWITEFGWTTGTKAAWGVTPQQQAAYIEQAVAILGGLDYVRAASVYELRDSGSDSTNQEDNWGLVRRDFKPKPAFAAFRLALGGGYHPRGHGAAAVTRAVPSPR